MSDYQRKKIYYCQLKKGFFKEHPHDILRSLDGGREALLLYVELLLESAGHEGHLMFSENTPFNSRLIAAKFATPLDIVEKSLELLEELELVQFTDTREIILPRFGRYVGNISVMAEYMKGRRRKSGSETPADDPENEGDEGLEDNKGITKDNNVIKSIEYRDKSIETRDKSINTPGRLNNNNTHPARSSRVRAREKGATRPAAVENGGVGKQSVVFEQDPADNTTAPLTVAPSDPSAALAPVKAPFTLEQITVAVKNLWATTGQVGGRPITEAEVKSWYDYQQTEGGWRYAGGEKITATRYMNSLRVHTEKMRREARNAVTQAVSSSEFDAVVESLNKNRRVPITKPVAAACWDCLVGVGFKNRNGDVLTKDTVGSFVTAFAEKRLSGDAARTGGESTYGKPTPVDDGESEESRRYWARYESMKKNLEERYKRGELTKEQYQQELEDL